jgi:hypothetical protein
MRRVSGCPLSVDEPPVEGNRQLQISLHCQCELSCMDPPPLLSSAAYERDECEPSTLRCGRMKQAAATIARIVVLVTTIISLWAATAYGATSGSGSDGGGTVTVGAGDGGSTVGVAGDPNGGSGPTISSGNAGPAGSPWTCRDQPLPLNDVGFAPGGPAPGGWFSVTCTNSRTGSSTTSTEWIADQATTAPASPGVDPLVLALQAESSLSLPRPVMHFSPSGYSVVNLPTWLWIDASTWLAQTVSAAAGVVSVTAVATPTSVSWSMGDGAVVTCPGPGTSYDTQEPWRSQTTSCAYTYATSSAGQASSDGNANDRAFNVTATVAWSVTWSAQGTPGGGALPSLTTSASSTLRVEQVESINGLAAWPGAANRGLRV